MRASGRTFSAPAGRTARLIGGGVILDLTGATAIAANPGQRYPVYFDGYASSPTHAGQETVKRAGDRALAVRARAIEVLADPDGTAVSGDDEAFIRATAVRQELLRNRAQPTENRNRDNSGHLPARRHPSKVLVAGKPARGDPVRAAIAGTVSASGRLSGGLAGSPA